MKLASSGVLGLANSAWGGPTSCTLPWCMNTSLSPTSRAKRISWVTMIRVMPSLASWRTTLSTSLTSSGSSAEVISSHSSTLGDMASARAIAEGIELLPQADPLQHLSRQLGGLGLGHFLHHLRREHDVFAHRQVREQVELLEHHADFLSQAAQVGAGGVEVFAVDFDHTVVDRLQAIEGAQQGRLTRAAAADDRDDLAFFNGQVDALEHVVIAVILMQGGNSKQRHAVSFPGSAH